MVLKVVILLVFTGAEASVIFSSSFEMTVHSDIKIGMEQFWNLWTADTYLTNTSTSHQNYNCARHLLRLWPKPLSTIRKNLVIENLSTKPIEGSSIYLCTHCGLIRRISTTTSTIPILPMFLCTRFSTIVFFEGTPISL